MALVWPLVWSLFSFGFPLLDLALALAMVWLCLGLDLALGNIGGVSESSHKTNKIDASGR